MLSHNRFALKEWATTCERLGRGEQVILLRKGGILERRGGFQLEHPEFFLFPTQFHEKTQAPPERVELGLYASVEEDAWMTDLERLRPLEGQHALPWEDVEHRFHYGPQKGLHVLALRAYRLRRTHVIENARAYAGCASWVEMEKDLPVDHEGPVLNRTDFRSRLEALQAALHG